MAVLQEFASEIVKKYSLRHAVHSEYKQFSCGLCDKEFTLKESVKRHFKKCSAQHGVTCVML